MDAFSKLTRLAGAAVLAVALQAGPALALDDDTVLAAASSSTEEGGKIQMAETPRDRVGLVFLAALGAMAVGGGITMVRQLGGKRPQADGEFRWR